MEVKYTGWLWKNNGFGNVSQIVFYYNKNTEFYCMKLQFLVFSLFVNFQVFDGNVETDKTFRFKTGKGKVIKVLACLRMKKFNQANML